jgi:hypothetical protein
VTRDDASCDDEDITAMLDAIDGAAERALLGLRQAADELTLPLAELD